MDRAVILGRVIGRIERLVVLLDRYGVLEWAQTLRRYLIGLRHDDLAAIFAFAAQNRAGLGGFLDLIICRDNGHSIAQSDEAVVDRSLIYQRSKIIYDIQCLEHFGFNISDGQQGFLCPVCGMAGDFHGDAFDAHGGVIGSGICCCCLYEPGFDDDQAANADAQHTVFHSVQHYRDIWQATGLLWRGPAVCQPSDWNAAQQLQRLLTKALYLGR